MARGLRIDVKNIPRIKRILRGLGLRFPIAIGKVLNMEHESLMTSAKKNTPVDTGALRSSGHVLPPQFSGDAVISRGAFGNAAVDYALKVHEDLNAGHTVGQAKYYESALMQRIPGMGGRISVGLRKELRNVVG